ncbi:MAG: diaminobutyrate--2-oxoglutarate transaminase [Deltaproteobacteria bacterium]|nr:diaminobutyrate--2-oxoglutarate transaminase [Deltaproteobacteria bacterium]
MNARVDSHRIKHETRNQPRSLGARSTIFERRESAVRSYSRSFPVLFDRAEGTRIFDARGRSYLDFLAGCSTLNYGHNHPVLKEALLRYIRADGISCGLDLFTRAKSEFLEALEGQILRPRQLDYLVQFPGPTGTNAVEAALKLARKVTGRRNVIAFTNGFHGVTLGALACTGNRLQRLDGDLPLGNVTRIPYAGYLGDAFDGLGLLEKMLEDPSSGIDRPAAIILETVQGEGGLNAANADWLRRVEAIARSSGALLIVDDIQAGIGRTGQFFSFEFAGIRPDIVTLAKSLSGYGLPLAAVLIRRDLDRWAAGEHNGTFRGNSSAFVTATAALDHFWRDDAFAARAQELGKMLRLRLDSFVMQFPELRLKGRGMMQGIEMPSGEMASRVVELAFAEGLIIETSGPLGEVVKILAPLIIEPAELDEGLQVLFDAIRSASKEGLPS